MLYLWISLGIVGGIAVIWLFIWINNNVLVTAKYTVEADIESRIKIVQLSDLHGKSFGHKNQRLIAKIVAQRPDVIAITGDIIHNYRERDKRCALELVAALSGIAPVLYVSGNHEMRNKGYRFFRKQLKEAGACVLDDCPIEICGITVVGLNCASLKNDVIYAVTPEAPFKVLLAHKPHFFKHYASADYQLVLSGHAHGGQWRLPFTGIGFYSPGQGLFPKLTSGMHVEGKTKMIISRGLGNSQCPVRLFNLPEIVVVNIVPIKESAAL